MNRIHRKGVDISTAFTGASRRLWIRTAQKDSPPSAPAEGSPANDGCSQDIPCSKTACLRTWIKKNLRPVAQFGYRFAKPILKPIVFRLRRYLIEGFAQDIQQDIQKVSAAVVQELQASLRQENEKTAAAVVQELQAVRESLRREVVNVQERVSQALQVQNDTFLPRFDRIEQYSCATARRFAINCGHGEVLVRTAVGFVLCAETDHMLLACLIDSGELEMGTRLVIQKFLKPGDVFVDVGANIGMHTLAAARAMQGKGKIFAFEPFAPTARLLEKTMWMNGFSDITEIHQAAVSNITGQRQLYLGATSGHHSLFRLDTPGGLSSGPVAVPVVRLDEIIRPEQRVDLLKIDAEGAELEVLEGGMEVIKNNPDIALIVEFGPSHLNRTGHTPKEWFAVFTGLGFDIRAIDLYTGSLEMVAQEQLQDVESVNLFLLRRNSNAWSKYKSLFS